LELASIRECALVHLAIHPIALHNVEEIDLFDTLFSDEWHLSGIARESFLQNMRLAKIPICH
jgi:hypothetical protein